MDLNLLYLLLLYTPKQFRGIIHIMSADIFFKLYYILRR